ncbi:E3 ubiquitin-protein ligase RMA1H1-like [Henckelia pumila]|uniref:E3 ubiquitin-protein ligase RMA1H1-like n=1 Tax=Henckelia pumila TaxID=405737 RepID=UPI003C6E06D4
MAYQQYFVQEWRPENISACFDCSICLDFARDPVVTLCGHLYCWPCIYKWFNSQTASSKELPQCPVCKAEISEKTMIPLYGRGLSFSKPEQEANTIPPRPSASGIQHLPSHNLHQNEQNTTDSSSTVYSDTVGMFGEMVYARVFGNSQSLYTYPNSYHFVGANTPRSRSQEIQADKSLNRVTIFLFCCILACLVLF